MERLLEVMRTLRGPDGCPWDRKQTHRSLRRYLLEEAAEAVDAVTSGGRAEMIEELGDVLLQVAFHAVIAEGDGRFGYAEIEAGVVDKLVRRHPHVFGSVAVSGADEVAANWRAIKAAERGDSDQGHRVPAQLPTLTRAAALGEAFGWNPDLQVAGRPLAEAVGDPEALGAALLTLVLLANGAGLDPELALRDALATVPESSAGP